MEKEVLYVKEIKPKKILQVSKVVTFILLVMSVITWIVGLVKFLDGEISFVELADYTKDTALNMMPYFCLAMSERAQYAVESFAKYFKKNESEEIV